MFKKLLLVGACAFALNACDQTQNTSQSSSNSAQTEAGAPELGAFGIDLANIDDSVEAGDDFFRHVNGKWLDTFEIPADRSNYGAFTRLAERSEAQVRAIIEDSASGRAAQGSNQQKIGDFYASFMDEAAIEAAGLDPARADLDAVAAAESKEDIARFFGSAQHTAPIGAFVSVDFQDPNRYITYVTHAGLGMPDRDYYLSDTERFVDIREKYIAYIEQMLSLAGDEAAADKAQAIMALETRIAEAHWERARRRDRNATYNLMTVAELEDYAPGFPWAMVYEEAGLGGETEFVIREKDAFPQIATVFDETPVETWQAYLTFHYLHNHAAYLPAAFDDANFDFTGRTLRGQPEQRDRWKRGVSLVSGALGEAIGEIYVERHFPADSKTQMQGLVENLRTAFRVRINDLDWMSEATKVEALSKLEKFTPKIGYADKWRDYSSMDIVDSDLLNNVKASNEFAWNYQLSRLGKPIDPTEWGMTPQTVNAYYSPNRNEIVFPAAILQAPFFDPNADPAVNYGGIGAVIGHEMGHGFDDQGRKTDGDGRLRDWWSEEDAARFQEKADMLGGQYAQYEPIEGMFLNPELTMGENIGDLGGLSIAYHAYQLSLDGQEAPVIDGYTGDQRFFMAWAQVWARLHREEDMRQRVVTGPHSPSEFRTNGIVRNMDAWYAAFNVTEDDELYLPPEQRVSIW